MRTQMNQKVQIGTCGLLQFEPKVSFGNNALSRIEPKVSFEIQWDVPN